MVRHLILDIGRDKLFSGSKMAHEKTIRAASKGGESALENMDYKKARGPVQVYNAIVEAESILHVMGHADSSGIIGSEWPKLWGARRFDISDLVDYLISENEGLDLDLIILDACSTGSSSWLKRIRKIIIPGHTTLVIATNEDVPFGIADYFLQTFYFSLYSESYPKSRVKRLERIKISFALAIELTCQATAQKSYFKLVEIKN